MDKMILSDMLKRDTLIKRVKDEVVKLTYMAVGIEGLPTTFINTEQIINEVSNLEIKATDTEIAFVLGIRDAWEFFINTLEFDEDLTYNIIMQIHKIACRRLVFEAGEIRQSPVKISGTKYIPPQGLNRFVVEDKLDRLLKDTSESGILRLMLFIMREQIFIDGNKRVAMLVANYLLIKNNIGFLKIIEETDVNEFLKLIINYYETEDLKIIEEISKRWVLRI